MTEVRPDISIAVIAYNHERFIGDTFRGIAIQQFSGTIEVVIGDDCSPDHTRELARTFVEQHPNVRLLFHEHNLGMMGNWTATINACTGRYIALCEGDDYWINPLKLQKQVDFLEANRNYAMCFHEVSILTPDGRLAPSTISLPEGYEHQDTLAAKGNYIHTPSVVFRNVLQSFPPEMFPSPLADFFLYNLLAEHGKLGYLPEVMAVYRSNVGIWSNLTGAQMFPKNIMTFLLLRKYFHGKGSKLTEVFDQRIYIAGAERHLNIEELMQLCRTDESFGHKLIHYLHDRNMNPLSAFPASGLIKELCRRIQKVIGI